MEIFSEIYNCYYQIMKHILCKNSTVSIEDLRLTIAEKGYEESLLYFIPKLTSGEWNFFDKDGNLYVSKISEDFYVPLTTLQKSYVKTILSDPKIQLFLDNETIKNLLSLFQDVPVLWAEDDFYYYDRYVNRDPFEDATYIQNFRTILTAMEQKKYLDIEYIGKNNKRVHHHYLPCRLEYSIKNDKFRLLGTTKGARNPRIEIMNLERMTCVTLMDTHIKEMPDINRLLKADDYKEPARLLIHTDRNALERTMLQFANYEKNTFKIDDHTYECLIYYNQKNETELLIEVLSFGPQIQVLGSERFLQQIKQRLYMQKRCGQF